MTVRVSRRSVYWRQVRLYGALYEPVGLLQCSRHLPAQVLQRASIQKILCYVAIASAQSCYKPVASLHRALCQSLTGNAAHLVCAEVPLSPEDYVWSQKHAYAALGGLWEGVVMQSQAAARTHPKPSRPVKSQRKAVNCVSCLCCVKSHPLLLR